MCDNDVMEPPLYFAEDHVFDIAFHPANSLFACSLINGWVKIVKYDSESVTDVAVLKHHESSTRSCAFSASGMNLVSGSKDKSISIIDSNGTVSHHLQDAHKDSVSLVKFFDEYITISGDDSGVVRVWDIRSATCVYEANEQKEAITGLLVSDNKQGLFAASLDGTLATYDLRKQTSDPSKLLYRSACLSEDLTAITSLKSGRVIATSTSEGALLLFDTESRLDQCKHRFKINTPSLDHMVKLDENTVIVGSEDGLVRGVSVYPNSMLQVLGQHEEDENFPITKLGVSHCKMFAASLSHDSSIKFYDISAFTKLRTNQYSAPTWQGFEENPYTQSSSNAQNEDIDDDDDFESDDDEECDMN